ncbi:LacI family DNA-binding transcriptional regulator [Bifidobacterium aquikefiri]|uniref:LacI family DNA-binding transcriptional regulator n=1 Tax=Bifidobacterium aquikefiri TaxID=1653207 RepID=UPI0039ED50D6
MITMTGIAKLTGVSQATVSRVLSGNTAVDARTRHKVLECVEKCNYQPNIMAQSLAGNKTFLFGVIVTDIGNPFFAEIVKAIEEHASSNGYSLIIFNTQYDKTREKSYLDVLKRYRVDGLIMVPDSNEDEYLSPLANYGTPMVIATRDVSILDCVVVDHFTAGQEVAKHLAQTGCKKFVYIGDMHVREDKGPGFISSLKTMGFAINDDFTVIEEKEVEHTLTTTLTAKFNCNEQKIGVFVGNDILAMESVQIIQDSGIEIPKEVAIVGFDNTYISRMLRPRLSTIEQPIDQIASLAVGRLIELIEGTTVDRTMHQVLAPKLIVRDSSK